jgi:hypothetical protein
MSRKVALGLLVVAIAAVPVMMTVASVARGHRIYRYRIRYDTFPASNTPLVVWLTNQPGVAQVDAHHDATWLYLTVHTYKRFPSPDVFAACEQFGYKGQGGSDAAVVRPLW